MSLSEEDEDQWRPEKYDRGCITPEPERMFRSGPPVLYPQSYLPTPAAEPIMSQPQRSAAPPPRAPAIDLGPPLSQAPRLHMDHSELLPVDQAGPSQCAKYRKVETRNRQILSDAEAIALTDRAIRGMAVGRPKEMAFACLDCANLPSTPVTGACGHTRCRACVEQNGDCPCGAPAPEDMRTDILIQTLIVSLYPTDKFVRSVMEIKLDEEKEDEPPETFMRNAISAPPSPSISAHHNRAKRAKRPLDPIKLNEATGTPILIDNIDYEERYAHARELMTEGRHAAAVPHLAKVAAFGTRALAKLARNLLFVILKYSSHNAEVRASTRLRHLPAVHRVAERWRRGGDLDCILCCRVLCAPVAAPCGHTYCRDCLQRSMDYKDTCPLCAASLADFNIDATENSKFVVSAIEVTGRSASQRYERDDRLPLFVCTNAYPMVPCPLYVFEPRYRLMIRRVMRSGSRTFGMVAWDPEHGFSDYGTILEIRDCVNMPDGRSILTTLGVSRFRILHSDKHDGYHVAYIDRIVDDPPSPAVALRNLVRRLHLNTRMKALRWIGKLDPAVRAEIELSFGRMPYGDAERTWMDSPDGPAWLWWVISVLPVDNRFKTMTVSTCSVYKRMLMVDRALDVLAA